MGMNETDDVQLSAFLVNTGRNAQVMANLALAFPGHNLGQIMNAMEMPIIDKRNAFNYAQMNGLIADHDGKGKSVVIPLVKEIAPSEDQKTLSDTILFAMAQLSLEEQDLQEDLLLDWTQGYLAHDVLIAVKFLEQAGSVAHYTIINNDGFDKKTNKEIESEYKFFTLGENIGKYFGKKLFSDQSKIRVKEENKSTNQGGDDPHVQLH